MRALIPNVFFSYFSVQFHIYKIGETPHLSIPFPQNQCLAIRNLIIYRNIQAKENQTGVNHAPTTTTNFAQLSFLPAGIFQPVACAKFFGTA